MNKTIGMLWLALLPVMPITAGEINWPEFRGPRADGSTIATGLPLKWSEREGVKWKTQIHGKAWSSPVIWSGKIWMTTATEDGRELSVICVDSSSGQVVKDLKLFDVEKPQYCHPFNSYASPTPVIEKGRLYVSFGAPATACVDTGTGKVLWERRDFECNHFRGAGSSPIVYGGLLFLNFDGSDHQYVVALEKRTGKTRWVSKRSVDYRDLGVDGRPQMDGDYRKAFATCRVVTLDDGQVLLSQGSKAFYAYETETGKELWRVEETTSYSGSTRPVLGHGLIFVPSGFSSGQLLAIRPGKPGEVLDAKNNEPLLQLSVVWKTRRNVPKKPSLCLVKDLLFGIDDNGNATCWEAATGEVVWSEKLGGHYSASPIAAPDRIYFFSEEGKTTVVAAAREFKTLAENTLGDGFMASPAVYGDALFLRSRAHLYRIEN